jgi:hypothetical protein
MFLEDNPTPTQTMLDRGNATSFCAVRYMQVWSSLYPHQLQYIILESAAVEIKPELLARIHQSVATYHKFHSLHSRKV